MMKNNIFINRIGLSFLGLIHLVSCFSEMVFLAFDEMLSQKIDFLGKIVCKERSNFAIPEKKYFLVVLKKLLITLKLGLCLLNNLWIVVLEMQEVPCYWQKLCSMRSDQALPELFYSPSV